MNLRVQQELKGIWRFSRAGDWLTIYTNAVWHEQNMSVVESLELVASICASHFPLSSELTADLGENALLAQHDEGGVLVGVYRAGCNPLSIRTVMQRVERHYALHGSDALSLASHSDQSRASLEQYSQRAIPSPVGSFAQSLIESTPLSAIEEEDARDASMHEELYAREASARKEQVFAQVSEHPQSASSFMVESEVVPTTDSPVSIQAIPQTTEDAAEHDSHRLSASSLFAARTIAQTDSTVFANEQEEQIPEPLSMLSLDNVQAAASTVGALGAAVSRPVSNDALRPVSSVADPLVETGSVASVESAELPKSLSHSVEEAVPEEGAVSTRPRDESVVPSASKVMCTWSQVGLFLQRSIAMAQSHVGRTVAANYWRQSLKQHPGLEAWLTVSLRSEVMTVQPERWIDASQQIALQEAYRAWCQRCVRVIRSFPSLLSELEPTPWELAHQQG